MKKEIFIEITATQGEDVVREKIVIPSEELELIPDMPEGLGKLQSRPCVFNVKQLIRLVVRDMGQILVHERDVREKAIKYFKDEKN